MEERRIIEISSGSPADLSGLKVGDEIVSVDGEKIFDAIDWEFATSSLSDGDVVEIEFIRGGERFFVDVEVGRNGIGIELAPLQVRRCKNKCVFCFIHQLPRGLRKSLYVKDEDFRFSFLYGSYITLTNLTEDDWRRIERQKLSPLYISVHATDDTVRKKMLGSENIPPILSQLRRLKNAGISFHTQIVLVPEYNDGDVLRKTVADLLDFYPYLSSIAVVPVGLTEHRKNLPKIRPVLKDDAVRIIDWHFDLRNRDERARNVLQLADEFFIIAGEKIPPMSYYDDFPQYENGVGMVRDFIDSAENWKGEDFPDMSGKNLVIITGTIFAPILKKYAAEKLKKFTGANLKIIAPENSLFGKSVTVANLLSGQDVASALSNCRRDGNTIAILPPKILNEDGLFLDDISIDKLKSSTKVPIYTAPDDVHNFAKFLNILNT